MECKNNKKYKVLGFILIMFFSFIFIDNVNALECKYWLKKEALTKDYSSVNNWTSAKFKDDSPIILKYNESTGYIEVNSNGISGLSEKKLTSCPDYIILTEALGNVDSLGIKYTTGTKKYSADEYKKLTGKDIPKSCSSTNGVCYAQKEITLNVYGSGFYGYDDEYVTWRTNYNTELGKIMKVTNSPLMAFPFFLEPQNLTTLRGKVEDITTQAWSMTMIGNLFKRNDESKILNSTKCPLDSINSVDSKNIAQLKNYSKDIEKLEKVYNKIAETVTLATADSTGIVTPKALPNKATLHALSEYNEEITFSKYPSGFKLEDLAALYKANVSTDGFLRQRIEFVANCFLKNTDRIYKAAEQAVKNGKIKESDLKELSGLKEASTRIKKKKNAISTLEKKANDKINNSAKKEEYKTCNQLFGNKFMGYVKWAYNVIEIGAIVLTVVLGMLDFAKAVAASEDGALKKMGKKFLKRIIAVVIIILLPVLINFILSVFNIKGIYGTDDNCIEMSD